MFVERLAYVAVDGVGAAEVQRVHGIRALLARVHGDDALFVPGTHRKAGHLARLVEEAGQDTEGDGRAFPLQQNA